MTLAAAGLRRRMLVATAAVLAGGVLAVLGIAAVGIGLALLPAPPPDIEVELDPLSVRQGRDPQLEKAVEVIMAELEKNPVPRPKRPPYPRYQRPSDTASPGRE